MLKLMLTCRAAADLSAMGKNEERTVRQSLYMLQANPMLGLKLWGQDALFLYETVTDDRIVYRLTESELQVLTISSRANVIEPADNRLRICGVVLAAGHTGYADTMPFSNLADTFLSSGIDNLIIVVGDHAEQARAELRGKNVTVVVNNDYTEGLSKSLRRGLKMVPAGTDAVMLSLGNRPFISRDVVSQLIRAYRESGSMVVVPSYSQMRGHPVIFNAALLPELLKVRGNAGGRDVIKRHIKELAQVNVGDAGVLERTWMN
jgi:CTP:molybdopterin cytidylyltransferase MocA